MSEPYVGEIRMFGGNFAPLGWALCQGQILSIAQNDVLFSLLGTTYGGDGQTTFALPNLAGRVPVHQGTNPQTGTNYVLGSLAGSEEVTLLTNNLPAHTHQVLASSQDGTQAGPSNAVWAGSSLNEYASSAPNAAMNATTVSYAGSNQPHDNMMPFLPISFIIALEGIYPQQN